MLSITHGVSGSGKSTIAMRVIERDGGIRIRSDVERQQIADQPDTQAKYSPKVTEQIYSHLSSVARSAIEAGFPVSIDATFLKREQRAAFKYLAGELGVAFRILDCDAAFDELCRRIRNRKGGVSEATVNAMRMQKETHDALTTQELEFADRLDL